MTTGSCTERNSAGSPLLVVIRGNSGSGKTTTAREVRRQYGARGLAVIEQDHCRRVILREHGGGGEDRVAPGFITTMARAALDGGYHVILEGILHTGQYGDHLRALLGEHPGPTACYFLDVTFDETVRRHLSREEPIPVAPETMRGWYAGQDLLGVPGEVVIPEYMGFQEVVTTILHTSGLAEASALTPCPTRCAYCAQEAADAYLPAKAVGTAPRAQHGASRDRVAATTTGGCTGPVAATGGRRHAGLGRDGHRRTGAPLHRRACRRDDRNREGAPQGDRSGVG
ncbi:AAA family ATPase [Actinoplanes flavus]|uniref:AAA family ATPase n=1 Tax=Actinoplanes flavus TaxID=2820290 RepID=UPI0027DC1627|nr:AAA family ATPase [Actinoplanes flavus]